MTEALSASRDSNVPVFLQTDAGKQDFLLHSGHDFQSVYELRRYDETIHTLVLLKPNNPPLFSALTPSSTQGKRTLST